VYFVEYGPEEFDDPRNEMLLVQYRSDLYDAEGNQGTLFVADVFVDGDLPTLQFNRKIWHAVSVPWQEHPPKGPQRQNSQTNADRALSLVGHRAKAG